MNCIPVTFQQVTSELFNHFKKVLREEGLEVSPGGSGVISGHGLTASFSWDGSSETLTVTVTEKPFHFSCGDVVGRFFELLEAGTHGGGGGQED